MVEVKIEYCQPCGYMQEARALQQGIEKEFGNKVKVTLNPGEHGIFDVYIGNKLVFSRHQEHRFPTLEDIRSAFPV